jgi:hypothetical protein
MTAPCLLPSSDYKYLELLKRSPFERRAAGWRFGVRPIADSVIARLVACGRARIERDRVHLVAAPARRRAANGHWCRR